MKKAPLSTDPITAFPRCVDRAFQGMWKRLSRVCGKGFPLGVDKGEGKIKYCHKKS